MFTVPKQTVSVDVLRDHLNTLEPLVDYTMYTFTRQNSRQYRDRNTKDENSKIGLQTSWTAREIYHTHVHKQHLLSQTQQTTYYRLNNY